MTKPCTLHGIPSTNGATRTRRATRREVRGRGRGVGRVDDPVHVRGSAVEPLFRVARPHRSRAAVEARGRRRERLALGRHDLERRRRHAGRREQGVGRGLVLERDPLGPAPAVRGSPRNVVQRCERRREHESGALGIEPRERLEERGGRVAEEPLLGSDRCRDVDGRRQIPLDDISVRRGRQRSGAAPHTEHEAAFGAECAQRRDSTGRPRDRPAGEHDPPIAKRVGQHSAHRLDARIHDASVTSRAPRAIGLSASGLPRASSNQTVLPPGVVAVPQRCASASTKRSPRPFSARASASRIVHTPRPQSSTSTRNVPRSSRATSIDGDCACTIAFVTSSETKSSADSARSAMPHSSRRARRKCRARRGLEASTGKRVAAVRAAPVRVRPRSSLSHAVCPCPSPDFRPWMPCAPSHIPTGPASKPQSPGPEGSYDSIGGRRSMLLRRAVTVGFARQ